MRIRPMSLAVLLAAAPLRAEIPSLNLGFDYRLRAIATQNPDANDATSGGLNYYSHSARLYMTAWLNQDVETSLRLQSINVWGLEGASAPVTRYPQADGSPWVEEAYVHLPNLAWKFVDLKLGRQALIVGDGMLVSDDGLGFNAVRARVTLPRRMDLDLFTAKMQESLQGSDDADLHGAVFGFGQDHNRWEFNFIQENTRGPSEYTLASGTVTAINSERTFMGIRLYGNLKDAYYKLEYALQDGSARLAPGTDIGIEGSAQKIELGAQTDTSRLGRFGVRALYAAGSGDDADSLDKDEAFRPTYAKRWNGLERSGYGAFYGATTSDVFSATNPFSPSAAGLPGTASGVKTLGLGVFTVQKVKWTAGLDYYIFDSATKINGLNSLGAELDLTATLRYTGFVTFQFGAAFFFPGDLYGPQASRVSRYVAETHIHF